MAEWPRATTDLVTRRPLGGLNTRDDRDDRLIASERSERALCTASEASVCVRECSERAHSARVCAREKALSIVVLGGFLY